MTPEVNGSTPGDNRRAVRSACDAAAPGYDALRRQLIPRFEDFYGAVLDILSEAMADRPFRCLDLGIGTGLLAEMILDRFPKAELIGLDNSEKMLGLAKARLGRFGDRARVTVADYIEEGLPGPMEAVVSALSIHHLEHNQKQSLFARVHETLGPGGVFVNADQSLGPTPEIEQAYQHRWESDVRAAGIEEMELASAMQRIALDRNAPLVDQLAWLRAAGFAAVDVPWKRYRYTVFHARRN